MKIVAAIMQHETNTFSPLPTPYEAFAGATGHALPPSGEAAIAAYGDTDCPFAAFLDLARDEGAEVAVPIAAYAEPSGPVADDAFERISGEICDAVAAGHGVCSSDHEAFPFTRLKRPIYPFDPETTWSSR